MPRPPPRGAPPRRARARRASTRARAAGPAPGRSWARRAGGYGEGRRPGMPGGVTLVRGNDGNRIILFQVEPVTDAQVNEIPLAGSRDVENSSDSIANQA